MYEGFTGRLPAMRMPTAFSAVGAGRQVADDEGTSHVVKAQDGQTNSEISLLQEKEIDGSYLRYQRS